MITKSSMWRLQMSFLRSNSPNLKNIQVTEDEENKNRHSWEAETMKCLKFLHEKWLLLISYQNRLIICLITN